MEQSSNIDFILVTDKVLKLDKFKYVKEEQSLNIDSIFITLIVLKLDTSKFFNNKQLLNIKAILITLCVSKLKSMLYKDLQSLNIYSIKNTWEVSKLVIFKKAKDEHSLNI